MGSHGFGIAEARERASSAARSGEPATEDAHLLTRGRPVPPAGSFLLAAQRHYGNRFVQQMVQPMLRAGAPGDRYERQADLIARRVAGHGPAGQELAGRNGGSPRPGGPARGVAEGGRPLGSAVAGPMEQAFGADLGQVRVHHDTGADDLCRELGARAFTSGDHIFLRRGEQVSDRHLLAHELTHVLQQRAAQPTGDAAPAGLTSAPRGMIQAFWVRRKDRYYWHANAKHKWRYSKLPDETHQSAKHPGKSPVYVEHWEHPRTRLRVERRTEPVPLGQPRRSTKVEARSEVVARHLLRIRRTTLGAKLLRALAIRVPRETVIWPSPRKNQEPETGYGEASNIRLTPKKVWDAWKLVDATRAREEVTWRMMPGHVVLFHELVHAFHHANGTLAHGTIKPWQARDPVDAGIALNEYQAVGLDTTDGSYLGSREEFTENKYRAIQGLPRRDTYCVPYVPPPRRASRDEEADAVSRRSQDSDSDSQGKATNAREEE